MHDNNNNNKKNIIRSIKQQSQHNTLYYLNANYLREDEHLARVITSSNAFSKSRKYEQQIKIFENKVPRKKKIIVFVHTL
ncbi:hypothetical protein DERP_010268 [Dermatophagoides pteronyssinus]|uniref:Uncharacterized protein n=1 Tax=Dermatophagoides pteronyssinus TaxID=6956 RepID=A0ABQ8J732_DERPT|nr:hypothetical protein DERP_010268 [Dermatophagoides pteronyssinus]